jgi:signal peptidase I
VDPDRHSTSVEVSDPVGHRGTGPIAVPSLELPTRWEPLAPGPSRAVPSRPVPSLTPSGGLNGSRAPGIPEPPRAGPGPETPGATGPGPGATRLGVEAVAGPSRWRWWLEWLAVVAFALVLAFGVRTYVAQMFYIPSGSMLPTLQVGDRIVVDKLSYDLHGIHRGDVVVFRRPPLEQADYPDLVKRVIGLPGDTIASVGGQVTIDGRPLSEPWLPRPAPLTLPSPVPYAFNLTHPYTVPTGHYFVMGDNRTNSEDSRYFGPIPTSLIVGKMAFVAWPLDDSGWLVVLVATAALLVVAMAVVALRGPGTARPGRAESLRRPPVPGTP